MKEHLRKALSAYFGYASFRHGQEEIISRVMAGRNVLGVLATGGGKSVTYQLPSLLLPGLTVVVSPLISLMIDQVQRLRKERRIPAAYLNSTLDPTELKRLLAEIGRGDYKLLYISPEKLQQRPVQERLAARGVSLVAVDEAHCISQWGHDFRTDYLRLPDAIRRLGNPTVLAVTATATRSVREEICRLLAIEEADVIVQPVNRPNIAYDIKTMAAESEKREAVLQAVRELQGPGIVYCRTRQAVEQLAALCMETGGIRAHGYHAGMSALDRALVQEQFLAGELDVIVATNAFGMGIDKADIRYVLHYHFPATLEEYAQEVGRIGRDGLPGYACLYVIPEDASIHQHMLVREFPTAEEIERFVAVLASGGGSVAAQEIAAFAGVEEELLDMLFFYAEDAGLITRVVKEKGLYRYLLHDAPAGNIAARMTERIERIRRNKWYKLQQMQAWLDQPACLRRGLHAYFAENGSYAYDRHCCAHCGLERADYLRKEPLPAASQPDAWNLEQALSSLLPCRKMQEAK
ncbi:ATP-dependent DNA helicase RecQ [Brevibacillus sp. SYP-B805]|uniref:RecQ family ATP-dependent DNA helicase n=1 Tax=Brevibacillus sp. SYP-B805 TaxID=1578199 RepID=UPI0013ED5052|nr:ATP-dependent DNA helicase RecQ [Brevibacillus sp. SYP-B805]NGQ94613.1 ATP-dependent DNA helicase RecQ [Brevibacillus sp. SYP-B805]